MTEGVAVGDDGIGRSDASVRAEGIAECPAGVEGAEPAAGSRQLHQGLASSGGGGGTDQVARAGQGHVAVSGTWLGIPEGQCFCLLGPNGAGKTTTLRCLTGVRMLPHSEE